MSDNVSNACLTLGREINITTNPYRSNTDIMICQKAFKATLKSINAHFQKKTALPKKNAKLIKIYTTAIVAYMDFLSKLESSFAGWM